jgi:hypothetical protein
MHFKKQISKKDKLIEKLECQNTALNVKLKDLESQITT